MANGSFISYRIDDRSFIAFVKREIHGRIAQTTFNETQAGKIDIIVSELTTNLVKHGGGGELLYRIEEDAAAGETVFEVYGIDKGPGMTNVAQMMRDGVSTTNTLGGGLGALHRLSDELCIYSQPEWGTIVYARLGTEPQSDYKPRKPQLRVNALSVPKTGESVCGDGYWLKQTAPHELQLFLGDGLGHGPHAHEAVQTAIEAFIACEEPAPEDVIRDIHRAVRKTRGLVGTVAMLNLEKKTCRISGVGNIATVLYEGLLFKKFMPYNGIIGLNVPNTMGHQEVPLENNSLLILCSDGINTRWDLSKYPALLKCEPPVFAGLLYKDFNRGNDDSSAVVVRVKF